MAVASPGPLLELPTVRADLERVEEALNSAVQADDPFLTQVASHLITAGGKRGRPLFTVAAAATAAPAFAPATEEAVMGGVAVELVHLGSLYHDDVMDDAETRRTVESVNARWGNLQAILAGDYLLARASEIAASLGTEVAALLARTIARLCEGQVMELAHTYDPSRSEDSYLASIEGKTAALFATAARVGALVAGLGRDQIDALTAFGRSYGMAFQIVDDVLDVTATDEQLGKPAGHDLVEGVYTLPVLRALATDDEAAEALRASLGRVLSQEEMEAARALVRRSGQVDGALETAAGYVNEARASLAPLGTSDAADALVAQADHLLVSSRELGAAI